MELHERAAPMPDRADDKFGMHRRFTSLVDQRLAAGGILPKDAGAMASAQIRREFAEKFPGTPLPPFLP